MLVAREDLRHDDALELAADFLHALDLEAEHGQPLGQFLRRPVEINVLFEPVKGDFHIFFAVNRTRILTSPAPLATLQISANLPQSQILPTLHKKYSLTKSGKNR